MVNTQNPQNNTVKPPKNPEVVHLNGRVLLRSVQRNTVFCGLLSIVCFVVVITIFNAGTITMATFIGLLAFAVAIPFFLLAYLLKICFIDGAMGALIIRGNMNQPITL